MKITDIKQGVRNPDRVNISVDGKYRFSLDIFQVGELGIKIGKEYTEDELIEIESESQFGKLYARALEYCLMRPHSAKEVRDYLWRKTRTKKVLQSRNRGRTTSMTDSDAGARAVIEIPGVSQVNAERTFNRLVERGYINDEKFARWWVENRNQTKGSSLRKLRNELRVKGVESSIIDAVLADSARSDDDELAKVIAKKAGRYDDEQKLIAYLARQGFSYDDIRRALSSRNDQ